MKRLMVLVVAVAALASLASLAVAGDYHVGRLLVCSDCHVAHGRTDGKYGHSYANPGGPDTTWLGPHSEAPPYDKLLKGETVNNACLNCHDGNGASGIPDVFGNTAQAGIPNGREAGALNVPTAGAHGYTNDAGYSQGDGHTLWSTNTPPGFTTGPTIDATEGLQCTDCHLAHGGKYFRNMQGAASTSTATYIDASWRGKEVNYVIGMANLPATNTPTTNIAVVEKSATTNHYDFDNVYYLEPDPTKSVFGDWCGNCHGDFHNNGPTAGVWQRHPTENQDLTTSEVTSWNSWGSPAKQLKLLDNTHTWSGTTVGMTPTCITCHKSHGNQNPFGLIFVYPNDGNASSPAAASTYSGGVIDPRLAAPAGITGQMTEQGNGGQLRDMCRNCHGMGRFTSGNPTNLNQ